MKKSMIALLFAAISISAMAEVLVYDYAASFKRIDVAKDYKKVKQGGTTYKLDSAKVASDKFTGKMAVGACKTCFDEEPYMAYSAETGNAAHANVLPGDYAVIYITRKGAKVKGVVYRAIGRFYAGMFGTTSGQDKTSGRYVREDKITEAYGFLSYALRDGYLTPGGDGFMGKDQKGATSFGWFNDQYAVDFDTIDHAGYGKVQVLKQSVEQTCGPDVKSQCFAVKSLSGNIVGAFYYEGFCSEFLFDVCRDFSAATDNDKWAKAAPINGTFTLKLTKKMFSTFEAAQADILTALKATAVYHVAAETAAFKAATGADLANASDKEGNLLVQELAPVSL